MADMRIWQVSEHDRGTRFYWFATKREAEAHAARARADNPNADVIDIRPFDVAPGRAGAAEAMNFVISLTCFNEN